MLLSAPNALALVWQKTVARDPRKIVLIDAASGQTWTAAQLHDESLAFDPMLAPFARGDRIAYRLPNGAEWLALFLALQRRGLTAIPLDAALPDAACFDLAQPLAARALFLEETFHFLEVAPSAQRTPPIACIKLTSGSAAAPKQIRCRAEHLLADGRQVVKTMGIRARDRNLASIPFGHSYGLGNLVLPLILQGTAIVFAAEFLPRQLVDWIRRRRVTVFPSVPAIFRVLAALPGRARLGPLRTAISAGAVLSPAIAQDFHRRYGVKIHNFYGASETGGICYDRTGTASLTGRSVGPPLAGVEVKVAKGRLTVASAAVATRTGSWRLNDRGEWNERGELVLLGRIGVGANIGGKKVHPLEVEQALRALPGVTDALVWRHHEAGRDLLIAAVETKRSRTEIEHALAPRLPAWKLPKHYHLAPELPRTARGKLDVAALRRAAL